MNVIKKTIYYLISILKSKIKNYSSYQLMNKKKIIYDEYIDHQKNKTTDESNISFWLNEKFYDKKTEMFIKLFSKYKKFINNKYALSVGSRVGNEVLALKKFTSYAKGIDIVKFKDLVEEGDMHKMDFDDCSFDFIFTNIIDHSLYPEVFLDEAYRILKPGGKILINCSFLDDNDNFTVFQFHNEHHVKEIASKFKEINFKFSNFELFNYWHLEKEIILSK